MRTYIYAETKFRVTKTKGGSFIPQHKSPFSSKFETFKEGKTTVIRQRRGDAEKFILRKAKIVNPFIEFVDESLPSEEEQYLKKYRELLAKKLNKFYWVSLSSAEMADFKREIDGTFNWLILNGVSDERIEQVEVEAGLYQHGRSA